MDGGTNQNGHPNGLPSRGSGGNCSLADLLPEEKGHQRQSAQMIATAIRHGYLDTFCVPYAKVKKWAEELAGSEDNRSKAAGVKVLTTMAQHDLKVWELLGAKEASQQVTVNVAVPIKVEFDRGG